MGCPRLARRHTVTQTAFVLALLAGVAGGPLAPADDTDLRTTWKLQGEYVGMATDGNRWGGQVIALGNDQFRGVGLLGGLPGEGWSRGDEQRVSEGKRKGMQVVLGDDALQVVIEVGRLKVRENGETVAEMKQVHRKSPTLGAKPPAGAIVLFDGQDTQAWRNAEPFDLDGMPTLKATGCETKEKFGNHSLHIEFRTPFVPELRGQARGNSGVYVQSRYEVQVLDSFGLEGADNECGGIYSIQRPRVNMCFPPESWQTYDIDFQAATFDAGGKKTQNARITVKHNGVLIHDNLELDHGTPGRHPEGAAEDALFLQDHGNPVLFRNIWAVKK